MISKPNLVNSQLKKKIDISNKYINIQIPLNPSINSLSTETNKIYSNYFISKKDKEKIYNISINLVVICLICLFCYMIYLKCIEEKIIQEKEKQIQLQQKNNYYSFNNIKPYNFINL